jgi:acyl phosphate:glycerol-3-phosphate acyltransferase
VELREALALAAAYLLGSIPFAFIAVRSLRGLDLRTVGSGNVGATNAGRVLGKRWAAAIYLLDAGKGAAAVLVGRSLSPEPAIHAGCGLLAILGHVFPVWLRFRGGKGVATTTGVFLALVPLAFVIAGAVWLAVAAATRFVSLASVALAIALPIAVVALAPDEAFRSRLPVTALAVAVALFVIATHLGNLRRVVAGTEPRIGGGARRGSA